MADVFTSTSVTNRRWPPLLSKYPDDRPNLFDVQKSRGIYLVRLSVSRLVKRYLEVYISNTEHNSSVLNRPVLFCSKQNCSVHIKYLNCNVCGVEYWNLLQTLKKQDIIKIERFYCRVNEILHFIKNTKTIF